MADKLLKLQIKPDNTLNMVAIIAGAGQPSFFVYRPLGVNKTHNINTAKTGLIFFRVAIGQYRVDKPTTLQKQTLNISPMPPHIPT